MRGARCKKASDGRGSTSPASSIVVPQSWNPEAGSRSNDQAAVNSVGREQRDCERAAGQKELAMSPPRWR